MESSKPFGFPPPPLAKCDTFDLQPPLVDEPADGQRTRPSTPERFAFRVHALRAEAAGSKDLKIALGLASDEAEMLRSRLHGAIAKPWRRSAPVAMASMHEPSATTSPVAVRTPSKLGQLCYTSALSPDTVAKVPRICAPQSSSTPMMTRSAKGQRGFGTSSRRKTRGVTLRTQ